MRAAPLRPRVELGGTWRFEPLARTEYREGPEGVVLAEDATGLPAAGEMPVPSNWHRHGLDGFHGRVRFSRDLPGELPGADGPGEGQGQGQGQGQGVGQGGGWWLCFGGVDYHAEVAVDGAVLARHEGAFDGFAVPLPHGARRLEVTVDAPREELGTLWPYRKRQFKGIFTQWEPLEPFQDSTGGIWGPVWLERRPAAHLDDVLLTTFLVPRPALDEAQYVDSGARDARVLLEATVVADAPGEAELALEICGGRTTRRVAFPAGASRHRLALTIADPVLWWPWDRGEPVLHDVRVTLGEDRLDTRVGIREVGFDEATGTFSVNGETIPVRGSNVIPEKHLAAYDAKRARADVALARDANLNAVRVCVHVAADELYDALDEAGILAWQDLPLQWDYLIEDGLVTEAADQAERIVRRLHDHPSIALWSCHNEPFPADRDNYTGPLVRAVRSVDGTRPVHVASDFGEHAYPGWFLGHIRDYAGPPAAAIMTEFGALGLPSADEVRALGGTAWPPGGRAWDALLHEPSPTLDVAGIDPGAALEDFVAASQAYQAAAVQRGIEAYRTKGLSFFHFLLMDGWPTVSWSVVSYDRVPKQAYDAVARACQPVLVGADLTRDLLSDAWDSRRFPPVVLVWAVNDTAEPLEGATWVARVGGHEVASGRIDVPARGHAQTVVHGVGQRWPSWTPPDLQPGEHHVELELRDAEGATRSRNRYPIRVVHRGLDLQPPT